MKASVLMLNLAWLAGACSDDGNHLCPDDTSNTVTGQIVEGEVVSGAPLSFPLKVVTTVNSKRPVQSVTIGGQPARLIDASQQVQRWEASLFRVNLERNAPVGSNQANIDVVVADICGAEFTIAHTTFELESAPGVVVSDLVADWVENDASQCSIPSDGREPALIRVTASGASLGGVVTLQASQGTFGNGDAKQDVTLHAITGGAEASAFFKPASPGTAVVTASARNDTADPLVLVVSDAPAVFGPDVDLQRGVTYSTTFTTTGNFDRCLVDEVVAAAATVTFLQPAVPLTNGEASVVTTPVRCGVLERVRAAVTFEGSAPDGAAVTIRCFDSDSRFVSKTLKVENLPPVMP